MVWEDCFTPGTKPGSRKVGSFTTKLISRVLDSKPSKLIVLKSSNANKIIILNFYEVLPALSFIAPVYSFVELINLQG
jgi:hypothetical protein